MPEKAEEHECPVCKAQKEAGTKIDREKAEQLSLSDRGKIL